MQQLMTTLEKTMNIRVPQADLNQGSSRTERVANRTDDAGAGRAAAGEAQPTSKDTVTLTTKAVDLRKLEESLASVPDVDQARVESIRAAISDGSYQVDTGKIIDQLLSAEKTLR